MDNKWLISQMVKCARETAKESRRYKKELAFATTVAGHSKGMAHGYFNCARMLKGWATQARTVNSLRRAA